MAINLAEKYSPIVDERFSLGTVTNIAFNRDYDWVGVRTVHVYSINTALMNNYTRSGSNRYGTPQELEDTTQELTLTRDRSFTYTVDRGNDIDQMNVKQIGASLRRQIEEVSLPELDTYRLSIIAANAGGHDTTAASATNAYKLFLAGQEFLGENKVPAGGRVAYTSYAYFNFLKLDPSFVKQGDMSQRMLTTGVLGMVDGIPIVPVPSSYLPTGTQFLLLHPIAAVSPVKLSELHVHMDPPGISGNLVAA